MIGYHKKRSKFLTVANLQLINSVDKDQIIL